MKILETANKLNIDEGLPQRVLNTSLILAGLVFLISISIWPSAITLGLTIGMGISIVFSMILLGSVKTLVKTGKDGSKMFFAIVTFLKFIVLSATLILVFKYMSVSHLALLAGVGLVQVVIFLKLISIVMVNSLNRTSQGRVEVNK